MTSVSARSTGWGRDVLVGLVGFWLVFSISYAVGRAAMPGFRSALGDVELATPGEGAGEVSIAAMRAELAPLARPAALLQARGAVDGRFVLDHGDSRGAASIPGDEEGGELLVDLNVQFSGDGAVVTLIADQVAVDQPRSEGMTVILTSDGQTFNAARGACTLELVDSGYSILTRPWGQLLTPTFAGHLVCGEVSELRSGTQVSFTFVFDYRLEH